MQIEPSIFKAYDIRGIYPDHINEESAFTLAKAFAAMLQKENPGKRMRFALGRDCRVSSPSIAERVLQGLLESGVDVDQLGLVSTPTFYFAAATGGCDGGIQVSASHNPKIWNGLKLVRAKAVPVTKNSGIMEMQRIIEQDDFPGAAAELGSVREIKDIVKKEADAQLAGLDLKAIKKMKILVDTCNGMGAMDMQELFGRLPQCEIVRENFELDGNFPGHGEADPIKPHILRETADRLLAEQCDLGIIMDGDADRIVFLDEQGQPIMPYLMRAVLAELALKEHPGAAIAYDLRPSKIIEDVIAEFGGKPVVTPVGNPLVKERMVETKAVFGGETSGHMIYAFDYGVMEAPIYLTVKFLFWLSERDVKVSEAILPFHKYVNSGDVNIPIDDPKQAAEKIAILKDFYKDGKQSELDGLSVQYPDFWFNIRPSNTEPLMRFTIEARTLELVQQKRDEVIQKINPQAKA